MTTVKGTVRRVGVISDTHGMLRSEAVAALDGVEAILHAGDIGGRAVMAELKKIAPVTAVRGNMDGGGWAAALPPMEIVDVAGVSVCMIHDLHQLDLDPAAAGVRLVVSGHTHQPRIARQNGVLYLNPGSAGPRRFDYPVSVAILRIDGDHLEPEIVKLDIK
jgi:putative phosphoesterase